MERKIVSTLDWNLNCVTPFSLLDEMFMSLGYPDTKTIPKYSHSNSTRSNLERKVIPLLGATMIHFDFCIFSPSLILSACLEYLGNTCTFHENEGRLIDLLPYEKVFSGF